MSAERDPRIYFAAERTLLAWVRTGLAMMGFGFVVARLEVLAEARGSSLWAGTALVFVGVIANVYAAISHARFTARFRRGDSDPRPSRFGIAIATIVAAVGFAMAMYLIVRG